MLLLNKGKDVINNCRGSYNSVELNISFNGLLNKVFTEQTELVQTNTYQK